MVARRTLVAVSIHRAGGDRAHPPGTDVQTLFPGRREEGDTRPAGRLRPRHHHHRRRHPRKRRRSAVGRPDHLPGGNPAQPVRLGFGVFCPPPAGAGRGPMPGHRGGGGNAEFRFGRRLGRRPFSPDRRPARRHLQRLAQLFRISAGILLGEKARATVLLSAGGRLSRGEMAPSVAASFRRDCADPPVIY